MKSSKRSPTGVWHCTCIACFDLKTLGKTLRSITSNTQRLFENVVLLLFGSSMSSKDVAFTGRGKNVWQSVCVLVSWSCRPVSAITTGNDRLFTLKSLQFFIILTISGDARHQTNSSPIHTRIRPDTDTHALLLLCTHRLVLSTQSLATKCLLECRTSVY